MNKEIRKQVKALEKLRLPALQAHYAEIVGEETKAPNRKFLLRRIAEALKAKGADASPAEAPPKPVKKRRAAKPADEPAQETEVQEEQGESLRDLSVEELQALYAEKVGRSTGSANIGYVESADMLSCGDEATEKPQCTACSTQHICIKVLPFRVEATVVARLDQARERLGLRSRAA